MENVIAERVKNVKLTKAQERIADYFIRNPEKVGMSSSMEVAKAIGVSDASITRFARAIGYEGFTDLKNDLYNHMVEQATGGINSLSLSERYNANQERFGSQVSKEAYMDLLRYDLERTMQQNSDQQLEQAITMLLQAKHRYIAGFRSCRGIAGRFAWLLQYLLPHIVLMEEEGSRAIGNLMDIGEKDCLVLFSVSRYYKEDRKLAQLAKQKGVRVCLVTNNAVSPLTALGDVVLLAETQHMSFFNSAVSMDFLLEYMVAAIAQSRSDVYRKNMEERDALTEDLRI